MYLSEIAPTSLRGFAGVFNQLAITAGVLVSQILGLDVVLGTNELWPYVLGKVCYTSEKRGTVKLFFVTNYRCVVFGLGGSLTVNVLLITELFDRQKGQRLENGCVL